MHKVRGDILLAGIATPDDHNITPLVTEFNGRHDGKERVGREGVGRAMQVVMMKNMSPVRLFYVGGCSANYLI